MSAMQLRGIETITLRSHDPARLAAFYSNAFGIQFSEQAEGFVGWVGETRFLIREHPTLVRFLALTSLEWLVDDVMAAATELRARGVEVSDSSSADRDGYGDAIRLILVNDVDGNQLQLIERLEETR